MTVRPPLTALALAVLLGLLAAFAAACGNTNERLLTSGKADSLKSSLNALDDAVASGRCERARQALQDLSASIETLPPQTAQRLRRRLEDGATNLAKIAPGECTDNRTDTEPTTTTAAPTTTEVVPTTTTPTATTDTTPTTTTPTTTTPTTTTTTPTTTTPPDGSGGGGTQAPTNGAGFVPPGQAKRQGNG